MSKQGERERILAELKAFTDEIIGGWIYGDIAHGLGWLGRRQQ